MSASRAATRLVIGVALVVAAPIDRPVRAQAAATESFADAIDVQLLDLQAVVTDREGRRVTGLGADDFVVRIDGEPVTIELFDEVLERPSDGAAARTDGAAELQPPVNYLVFIDDMTTLERNRDFVLERLIGDLDLLAGGDRMAVVRLGRGRKLRVLADWTSDPSALEAALREAMTLDAWGIRYIALRRMDDFVANWEGNDTRRAVLAAAGSMRMVEPPEGRRALLLVAGSWDPREAARADFFSPWCVTGRCRGTGVYDVLTDTANQFGYAIYAIDVEGTDPDFNWGREKRLHHVLGEMARVTGGKRLLNGDRGRMLAAAIDDTRSYYAIGVTPPPDSFDRRLQVEIEALPDGLTVRSQSVAVPVSPARDRELGVLNALWREAGADEGVALALGGEQRLAGGRSRVRMLLAIESEDGLGSADLTLRLAAVDSRSDSEPVRIRRLRLPTDREGGRLRVVPWEVELRRRRHTLVVEVEDRGSGTVRTAVTEFVPGQRAIRGAAAGGG